MENLGRLAALTDPLEFIIQSLGLLLFGFLLPGGLLFFYAKAIIRFNAQLYPRLYNWPSQSFWTVFLRFMSLLWILFGVSNLLPDIVSQICP